MATSTFNKNIVLNREAAKHLAKELRKDTPNLRPKKSECIPNKSTEEMLAWIRTLKHKSQN